MTLLEVLMAVGISAVAVITMVGVFLSGLKLMAQGRDHSAATGLARETLETVKDLGYGRVPTGTFDGRRSDPQAAGFPPSDLYPKVVINGQEMQLKLKVVRRGTLKSVTAEVFWGPTGRVVLQTYLSP